MQKISSMELNQWQKIKELCRTALTQNTEERTAYLAQMCRGDEGMRQGLESLVTLFLQDAPSQEAAPGAPLPPKDDQALTPQRWHRIEQIFQAADDLEPEDRADFLARECVDDESLRREVEALLRFLQPAPNFIQGVIHEAATAIKPSAARDRSLASSGDSDHGQFVPGAILAGRYRIVGLLGRGGMGEVYRADDLKLGQAVALKFLTDKLARDGAMLARFHSEVRIARQVSHPNVCRVHDIGEIETDQGSRHFLSMEYVDGEDLASLLRRIGRLPPDKALEIARQLCAGLAAAHDAGILHRDLKPANIMIDGRGRARITDFGLAGLAEQFRGREVVAGTPAYMAPEQLAGKEVTVRSDIYALGLLLYELFTGKRVFEASTLAELQRLHESSTPTTPSSWVKDIDPLVERVILRCLERDPDKRLASAMQVAAALPGGDPLAAALAAGETPSPEMVAAAATQGALRPIVAAACLIGVLLGLAVLTLVSGKTDLHRFTPLEKPPEALADRASTLIQNLGYHDQAIDTAYGWDVDFDYLRYVEQQDQSPTRWEKLKTGQPAAMTFWYRRSPRYLYPSTDYAVSPNDPPAQIGGMVGVRLDTLGRLIRFRAVPPSIDPSSSAPLLTDWAKMFSESGLSIADFNQVEPIWTPPSYSDSRAAWEGVFPDQPMVALRVEAASFRGRPVWFELLGPWKQAAETADQSASRRAQAFNIVAFTLLASLLSAGVLLARRNWKLGRGDRKGAARLALFVFAAAILNWVVRANRVPILTGEVYMLGTAAGWALVGAGILWVAYLALEPYARRKWPERIIGWTRLLAGAWRDPMVGRDILIGSLIGVWAVALKPIEELMERWLGAPPQLRRGGLVMLDGWRGVVHDLIVANLSSVFVGFALFMIVLLAALLLRRDWLAVGVGWLLFFTFFGLQLIGSPLGVILGALNATAVVFALMRFGLLAVVAWHVLVVLTNNTLFTTDFSAWYSGTTVAAIAIAAAIAAYGFYTSLAGQKLFQRSLLDPTFEQAGKS